jgi:hypothetical protein
VWRERSEGTRTNTGPILNRLSLPLDYAGMKVVLPAGLEPAISWFEARRPNHLGYGSVSFEVITHSLKVDIPQDAIEVS